MKKYAYHYRLTPEFKDSDSIGIEGIIFTKKWLFQEYRVDKVNQYVKTPANPKGILECRKVDLEKNTVVEDYTVKPPQEPILLSVTKISGLDRKKLEEVADSIGVKHIGIITNKLKEDVISKTAEIKQKRREERLKAELEKVEEEEKKQEQ